MKRYVPPESVEEQWDVPGLETTLAADYQLQVPVGEWLKDEHEIEEEALRDRVAETAEKAWKLREEQVGADLMRQFERSLMLQTLDHHWREHLSSLDYLRQGIHLRGYAQKNPKQEYKREAFELFSDMLDRIKQDVVKVDPDRAGAHAGGRAGGRGSAAGQRAVPARCLRRGAGHGGHRRRGERRRRARTAAAVRPCRPEGRPQRSVSVRLGQEVQALPRPARMSATAPAQNGAP